MAQREKEIQVPETLTPCANNCGFPANPATNNLCQACFNASRSAPHTSCSGSRSKPTPSPPRTAESTAAPGEELTPFSGVEEKKSVNRCAGCRKRVGLTGFRCRCGELFCGIHRYSDRHDCPFDYRDFARAAIARDNPVVRAAKLVRI